MTPDRYLGLEARDGEFHRRRSVLLFYMDQTCLIRGRIMLTILHFSKIVIRWDGIRRASLEYLTSELAEHLRMLRERVCDEGEQCRSLVN